MILLFGLAPEDRLVADRLVNKTALLFGRVRASSGTAAEKIR
jgi:hypothetical protein